MHHLKLVSVPQDVCWGQSNDMSVNWLLVTSPPEQSRVCQRRVGWHYTSGLFERCKPWERFISVRLYLLSIFQKYKVASPNPVWYVLTFAKVQLKISKEKLAMFLTHPNAKLNLHFRNRSCYATLLQVNFRFSCQKFYDWTAGTPPCYPKGGRDFAKLPAFQPRISLAVDQFLFRIKWVTLLPPPTLPLHVRSSEMSEVWTGNYTYTQPLPYPHVCTMHMCVCFSLTSDRLHNICTLCIILSHIVDFPFKYNWVYSYTVL